MKKLLALLGFLLLFSPLAARADIQVLVVASCGAQTFGTGLGSPLTMDTTGKLCDSGGGGGGGGAITAPLGPNTAASAAVATVVIGNAGAITQSSVSVTNASTALLTAAQFTNFEKICVALTATTGVWINWAGVAAVTAAPSEYTPPGQCATWVKSTGFLPTAAAFAISNSASTIAVTVEGN